MKKHILLGLSVLLLLSVLVMPAHAAAIDTTRTGSITATMVDDGEPIPGGTLTLYRVADLDLSSESAFRYVDEYADCGIELDDFGPSTATALAVYTVENDIQGQTEVINARGKVTFADLEPGLYLLIQWKSAEGYFAVAPFLVSIPNNEDGEYVYDVDCVPKQELIPEPTLPSLPTCPSEPSLPTCPSEPEPPTTTEPEPPTSEPTKPSEEPTKPSEKPSEPSEEPTKPSEEPSTEPTTKPTEPKPTEPQLPQTGQTNWPIPVLAAAGVILVILGGIVMAAGGRKRDEV